MCDVDYTSLAATIYDQHLPNHNKHKYIIYMSSREGLLQYENDEKKPPTRVSPKTTIGTHTHTFFDFRGRTRDQ